MTSLSHTQRRRLRRLTHRINTTQLYSLNSMDTSETKSDDLVKKIEAELTCAICLDQFNEPKVLPCLHTYCRKCVESLATDKSSEGSSLILCPQCREEHALPKGGAKEFLSPPTFTTLVKLLEVYKADQSGSKAITCEKCRDSNPAIVRCLDCDAYLCELCLELHKMKVTSRSHMTMSFDEIKESGGKCFHRPQSCADHNKELKLYCCTCSKLLCDDCSSSHSTHKDVLSISYVHVELKKTLKEYINSLEHLSKEAKEKKERVDKVMTKHKANVAAVHAKVDNTIEGIVELLKKRQAEIHGEIDTQAKQEEEAITADVETTELTLNRLTSNLSFVDRLLQTASDCELLAAGPLAVEHCKKLKDTQIDNEKKMEVTDWDFDDVKDHNDSIAGLKVKVKLPVKENTDTRK